MLKEVRSGGQTGADIAGVKTAKLYGLKTGGKMPLGFLTQDGYKPEYEELYGMEQHGSPLYPPRTFDNVKDTDGTIRFAYNFNSSGERCTLRAIAQYRKPHWDVDLMLPCEPQEVVDWIQENGIERLNVAGNAEKTHRGMEKEVSEYLSKVFELLGLRKVA